MAIKNELVIRANLVDIEPGPGIASLKVLPQVLPFGSFTAMVGRGREVNDPIERLLLVQCPKVFQGVKIILTGPDIFADCHPKAVALPGNQGVLSWIARTEIAALVKNIVGG